MIDMIGFDADDTLWQNENNYIRTKRAFAGLFTQFHDPKLTEDKLDETEMRNIHTYGFGIKSFTLSMIETAIEVTGSQVTASDIQQIIALSKKMLSIDVQLFEQVEYTLADLSKTYNLMLITKGDTFEQESKVSRSGIAHFFRYIEIVGDKSVRSYQTLLNKYDIDPKQFLMVGNSLRSDILPALAIGSQAVYIPYENSWSHENDVDYDLNPGDYYEIEHIGKLPELLESLTYPGCLSA